MSNDAMRVESLGVKCDTEGCDFKVSFGAREEYTNYLNKPCPICGANLLTQEDHDTMSKMLDMMEAANQPGYMEAAMEQMPPEILEMIAKLEDPNVKAHLRVEFVDGIPVMSSKDPEIQGFIEQVQSFFINQGVTSLPEVSDEFVAAVSESYKKQGE